MRGLNREKEREKEEGLEIFKTFYVTEATPTNQVFVPSLVIAVAIVSLASVYTKKLIKF